MTAVYTTLRTIHPGFQAIGRRRHIVVSAVRISDILRLQLRLFLVPAGVLRFR